MAVVRRSWLHSADRSSGAAATRDWSAAEPTSAADPGEVIEGGAPSWHRPRIPRLRWPVGIVLGIALAAAGAAIVWSARSAEKVPSPASLRALPPASSGLLRWEPRGQLVADDGFVRDALRTLQASGVADRPRTRLHLLYAGGSIVLVEGRDRNDRPTLAQVVDGQVLVDRLLQREPVALTLPAGGRLRFLVPPLANGAASPAEVWVRDILRESAGGFSRWPADATGLTDPVPRRGADIRFVVLVPQATGEGYAARLQGDGVVVAGSLTPAVPAIRLTNSPWPGGGQPPSRDWLADAELLGAKLSATGPVRVASLPGSGGGFTPGGPRPDGKTYSSGLYAVTNAAGQDYVGYVLRFGDEPLCHRLTPVPGRFADLLVVGDRCGLPGESVGAIQLVTRADVRSGTIELSGLPGRPPNRSPITGGVSSGLIALVDPTYPTVKLTAASDRSAATYVVPPP